MDEELMLGRSKSTSEDVNNADKGRGIPLDCDSAVNLVIPKARAWNVESTISFLHDDTVSDKFEVFVDCGNGLKDLRG